MAEFSSNNDSGKEEFSGVSPLQSDQLSLLVQECSSTSYSEVYISQNTMTKHVWYGDSKVLLGKYGLRTACTFLTDPANDDDDDDNGTVPDDKIKINSVIRAKLAVSVGDSVTILKDERIPHGKTVSVRPFQEIPNDLESINLFEAYLRPHFKDAFRPVHNGDVFHVTRNRKRIKFKITNIDPAPFCTVGRGTRIICRNFSKSADGLLNNVESVGKVRFINCKTDKELEENINRRGPSSGNSKQIHSTVANSSEGNAEARGGCQLAVQADLLKRKHNGSGNENVAEAEAKSRKLEAKMGTQKTGSTTTSDDNHGDDWGCASPGNGGGGGGKATTSFGGKSVTINQGDEDDWDSPAVANSSIIQVAPSRSRRNASVPASKPIDEDDWGLANSSNGCSNFNSGSLCASGGRRVSFGAPNSVSSWNPRDRGGDRGHRDRFGNGGRGWSRDFRSKGGNSRGGNGNGNQNQGGREFRGGRGRGSFQNRTCNNSYGAPSPSQSQTVTSNIADADEDWETPVPTPTPVPVPAPAPVAVPSNKAQCYSEIDDWDAPAGIKQVKSREQPNNQKAIIIKVDDQSELPSVKEAVHKVKLTKIPGCDGQPGNSAGVLVVGDAAKKATSCEQGIIKDPAALDMHQNPNLEPPLNEETLQAEHQTALSLFCRAKFAKSMSKFKMVLAKRTMLLGYYHMDTLRSHFFVGKCTFKEGNVLEAKKVLEHVLKIQSQILSADHNDIAKTEFAIARCFDVLENYKEAETLYRILYNKFNTRLGPSHTNTLNTQYNLGHALDKQKKLDDAMKCYATFVALGAQHLGPQDELVLYAQERLLRMATVQNSPLQMTPRKGTFMSCVADPTSKKSIV